MSDTTLVLGSLVIGDKKFELRVDAAPSLGREVNYSAEIIAIATRLLALLDKVPPGASIEISYEELQDICRVCYALRAAKPE